MVRQRHCLKRDTTKLTRVWHSAEGQTPGPSWRSSDSHDVIQASSAHLTNIFEMVNHPLINILMVPESKIRKRHYWLIFKLPWRHVGKIHCNGLVFFLYHDSWKNAWKTFCIRTGQVIRRSGIKCCLRKWRHRIKRQSKTTIILLANNFVR